MGKLICFYNRKQSDILLLLMFTRTFYQKGTHSFQKNALLFILSSEFEGALFTMARANSFKINALE